MKKKKIVAKKAAEPKEDLVQKHWKGMPDFNQDGEDKPIKRLVVNFKDKEAMLKFSKLVGQQVTAKTRAIWFPEVKEEKYVDKRWTT